MKLTKQLVIGGLTLSCAAILGAGSVNATTAIVDVQSLNFREEPSTSSESIDGLVKGEEIEVLEELDGWYKVKVRGDIGYVASDYVKIKGEESNTEEQEENKEEEQEEEQQKQEEETTQVEEQEETKNEEQVKEEPKKEENNSTTTKVKSEFKIKEASLQKDAKAYILPLINSSVLKNLSSGTNVTIYDEVSNWYYIQDDEISGWVLKSAFGEVVDQAQTTQEETKNEETTTNEEDNKSEEEYEVTEIDRKIMYVNSDSIFVRKGPGTDYKDIDMLELNDIVSVEGESGDWYKVDIQGKKGFIAKRLLSDEEQATNEEQETTSRGADERNIENKQEEQVASTSKTYSSTGEEIAALAQEYLGCPYVYGGSGPDSFDCSGFTMYIYKQFGVNLSHSATAQSKVGEYVDKEDLMPGDLVFFKDYQTMDGIGHCGIYVGDGDFIHASSGTGYCVKTSTLLSGSYNTRYETARRIF